MNLELIKKIPLTDIENIFTAKAFNENKCLFLCDDKERKYKLLYTTLDESALIDLPYNEKSYSVESNPVLFSVNHYFGIVKSVEELLLFNDQSTTPQTVDIQNRQILPSRLRLLYQSPVNDGNILPICFEKDVFMGQARDIAFLQIDTENLTACWQSHTSIDSSSLIHHNYPDYPPKLDSISLKDNEMYVFTSGGQITSVPKWGMDYYACLRCNTNGAVAEILLDSGNLHAIDAKKRGVNVVFSSSQKYLILTPVFQNDEWKGKQWIFSFADRAISEVGFPRGFGKYARLIDHYGDLFWVYLVDNKEIAACRLK